MAWRLTYLVTTLPRATAEVSFARSDWAFDHKGADGSYIEADARKIGYGVPSPVTHDNAGKAYFCELVSTHYNEAKDELIFVWKPALAIDDLPGHMEHLKRLADDNLNPKHVKYAGDQDVHTERTPTGG